MSSLLQDLPRHHAAPAISEALRPVQRIGSDNSKMYLATHDRTEPPDNQVVRTEVQNALLRQFKARVEAKRQKRASSDAGKDEEEPRAKRKANGKAKMTY